MDLYITNCQILANKTIFLKTILTTGSGKNISALVLRRIHLTDYAEAGIALIIQNTSNRYRIKSCQMKQKFCRLQINITNM